VVTNTWQVFTRQPRISTTLCSCRLWPSPPMYEETSKPLVRRTRHTLRSAELGFFRRSGVHTGAHATTLRAVLQRRYVGFLDDTLTRLTYQLVDSCHLLVPLLSGDAIVLQEKQNGRNEFPPNLGDQESKEDLVPSQGKAPTSPPVEP